MKKENELRQTWGHAKLTASVFCALVALVLAAIFWICRIGFPNYSVLPLVKILLLTLFALFFPHCYRLLRNPNRQGWYMSEAAMLLWSILMLTLSGLLASRLGISLAPLFYVLGALFFGFAFTAWVRASGVTRSCIFLMCALGAAVPIAIMSFFHVYQDPLINELVTVGLAHRDTLFHASVTSMIKTYGIPTTGLDGIPYLPYHTGSNWILAQLSALTDLPALQIVTMGYVVFFIPFFLNAMLIAVVDLKSRLSDRPEGWALERDVTFWAILAMVCIGVFPGENGQLASQSQVAALAFSFIFFSLCLFLSDSLVAHEEPTSVATVVLVVIALPALASLIGFCKVSLIWLVVLAYFYFGVRLRLFRRVMVSAGLVTMMAALIVTLKVVVYPSSEGLKISPLYVMNWYPYWWPLFFITAFIWSWIFIALAIGERKIYSFSALKKAFRDQSSLDVEAILIVSLGGAVPALLLGIPDASGFYFVDPQKWLAAVLLLANLFSFTKIQSWTEGAAQGGGHWPNRTHPQRLVVCFVSLALMVAALMNLWIGVTRTFLGGQTRTRIALHSDARTAMEFTKSLSALPVFEMARRFTGIASDVFGPIDRSKWTADNLRNSKVIEALEKLARLPSDEKRQTLLFIPKSNRLYWDLPATMCKAIPFIAPAITGIAMIDGLPGDECADIGRYGYAIYLSPGGARPQAIDRSADLCALVRQKGFCRVIIFDSEASEQIAIRTLACDDCPH